MELMAARRRLLAMQNSREPVIGDIWTTATKTTNKTINSNGAEISESGMVCTDYLEIIPETGYTMTVTAGTTGSRTRRIVCYDTNKTFISQLKSWSWMNNGQTVSETVTMPANAKYARMCAYSGDAVSVIGLMP